MSKQRRIDPGPASKRLRLSPEEEYFPTIDQKDLDSLKATKSRITCIRQQVQNIKSELRELGATQDGARAVKLLQMLEKLSSEYAHHERNIRRIRNQYRRDLPSPVAIPVVQKKSLVGLHESPALLVKAELGIKACDGKLSPDVRKQPISLRTSVPTLVKKIHRPTRPEARPTADSRSKNDELRPPQSNRGSNKPSIASRVNNQTSSAMPSAQSQQKKASRPTTPGDQDIPSEGSSASFDPWSGRPHRDSQVLWSVMDLTNYLATFHNSASQSFVANMNRRIENICGAVHLAEDAHCKVQYQMLQQTAKQTFEIRDRLDKLKKANTALEKENTALKLEIRALKLPERSQHDYLKKIEEENAHLVAALQIERARLEIEKDEKELLIFSQKGNEAHHRIRDRLDIRTQMEKQRLKEEITSLRADLGKQRRLNLELFILGGLAKTFSTIIPAVLSSRFSQASATGDRQNTRSLDLFVDWTVMIATGDGLSNTTPLRSNVYLPHELRVAIGSHITNWRDFTAYRHLDRANLQIFSKVDHPINTKFCSQISSRPIQFLQNHETNADRLLVYFARCAKQPCLFQALLRKAEYPPSLSRTPGVLLSNSAPTRSIFTRLERHLYADVDPSTNIPDVLESQMFHRLNFFAILQKLVAESTSFPIMHDLDTVISDLEIRIHRAFDRLLNLQKLSADDPDTLHGIGYYWGLAHAWLRNTITRFRRIFLSLPLHTRGLCHASLMTTLQAVETVMERFSQIRNLKIIYMTDSAINLLRQRAREFLKSASYSKYTEQEIRNCKKMHPLEHLRHVTMEGTLFLSNITTLIKLSEVESWGKE